MSAMEGHATTKTDLARGADVGSSNQLVTFQAGGTNYGVDVMRVREIRSWTSTTRMPGRDGSSRGMLDIRGKVVEVFDLALALGGPPSPEQPDQVIVVVSLGARDVGLLVDAVSDIIFTDRKQLLAPPDSDAMSGGHVTAIVDRDEGLIAILDVVAMFAADPVN